MPSPEGKVGTPVRVSPCGIPNQPMKGKVMSSTIPSPEDARRAALARRKAERERLDQETLEKRSLLYGDLQLETEELMEDEDVDDVPRLEAALAGLRGQSEIIEKTVEVEKIVPDPDVQRKLNEANAELAGLRKESHELKTENGRLNARLNTDAERLASLRAENEKLKERSQKSVVETPVPSKGTGAGKASATDPETNDQSKTESVDEANDEEAEVDDSPTSRWDRFKRTFRNVD